jgi:hypothetical protein
VAYIRKYRDGWRAEVERHGHRASFAATNKREVQAWALKKEAELDALKASGGKTFLAAVEHYRATVTVDKRARQWEERALDRLLEQIAPDEHLSKIDSERIGRWRDMRKKVVSGSTVNREANLLRNIFSRARLEWKWIQHNPFAGVKLPKENAARTAVWRWQQMRRVLRSGREGKTGETVRAFHVALHTGLRLQEVLTGRYVPARRVIVLPLTKAGEVQEVPVTTRAARILPKLMQPFTVDPNEASVLFGKLSRQLLIEGLTFHDARATALTLLARKMDVMTLARISRHKDLRILLNTYYRETAEQIAARL